MHRPEEIDNTGRSEMSFYFLGAENVKRYFVQNLHFESNDFPVQLLELVRGESEMNQK